MPDWSFLHCSSIHVPTLCHRYRYGQLHIPGSPLIDRLAHTSVDLPMAFHTVCFSSAFQPGQ